MTTTLTVTLTAGGSFTLTVPVGITASEYVRSTNIGGGIWNTATNIFYPMYQIASIAVSTS